MNNPKPKKYFSFSSAAILSTIVGVFFIVNAIAKELIFGSCSLVQVLTISCCRPQGYYSLFASGVTMGYLFLLLSAALWAGIAIEKLYKK